VRHSGGLLSVGKDMPLARAAGGELLSTGFDGAREWLLAGVGTKVLLKGALLVPPLSTAFVFTHEWLLSSVNPCVNEQVSGAKKALSTASEGACVRFGSLVVASAVVHEVSFGAKVSTTTSDVALEQFFLLRGRERRVKVLVPKMG